jgi:hypothetical protein
LIRPRFAKKKKKRGSRFAKKSKRRFRARRRGDADEKPASRRALRGVVHDRLEGLPRLSSDARERAREVLGAKLFFAGAAGLGEHDVGGGGGELSSDEPGPQTKSAPLR